MPLTHVCIWDSKKGFMRITAEEADNMFDYTVSARSGIFVCELCAQNVLFTGPGENIRHFRHDPSAPNKECDERQKNFDSTYGRSLSSLNSHVMPLKLSVTSESFYFQLGFFQPPGASAYCDKIIITDDNRNVFEYSFERIERGKTTFLNVGSFPSKKYGIKYLNASVSLQKFWPSNTPGLYFTGSFFDEKTGQMLNTGAKAYSSKNYYLLQRYPIYLLTNDIELSKVRTIRDSKNSTWYLYRVKAKRFSEHAAKFFLRYAIFLTEKPTEFYPIWPPNVKDPYIIYHNSPELFFYMSDDEAELKAFPVAANVIRTDDGKLYRLQTRGREQLVSLGKSGALGFSYLIKQPLHKKASLPNVEILDSSGKKLTEDAYTYLPQNKMISVLSGFDGKVVIISDGATKYVYQLDAEQLLMVDSLSYNMEIIIYQGIDCVRTIRFQKNDQHELLSTSDDELLHMLQSCKGPMISLTHSFGTVSGCLSDYPKSNRWIHMSIKNGEMPRSAYILIKKIVLQKQKK